MLTNETTTKQSQLTVNFSYTTLFVTYTSTENRSIFFHYMQEQVVYEGTIIAL